MEIKDSGKRKKYSTGANRDESDNKPRFTLMPCIYNNGMFDYGTNILDDLYYIYNHFKRYGIKKFEDKMNIKKAIKIIINREFLKSNNSYELLLKVCQHFTNGYNKYNNASDPVPNWQLGLPISGYIDSAFRHYVKYKAGYTDEPHYEAFLWNLICMEWTINNIDIDVIEKLEEEYKNN